MIVDVWSSRDGRPNAIPPSFAAKAKLSVAKLLVRCEANSWTRNTAAARVKVDPCSPGLKGFEMILRVLT